MKESLRERLSDAIVCSSIDCKHPLSSEDTLKHQEAKLIALIQQERAEAVKEHIKMEISLKLRIENDLLGIRALERKWMGPGKIVIVDTTEEGEKE